jgi:transketolase C-terminal domain/subunit
MHNKNYNIVNLWNGSAYIVGSMGEKARIGITRYDSSGSNIGLFAQAGNAYTITVNDVSSFFPDNESLYALKFALDSKTAPVTIATSRSAFKQYQTKSYEDVSKGAYVISNTPNKSYRLTLIATGSEVETAIRVQELLARKGISARVVSAPCLELFDKQNPNYICETLGNKPIISIEYGVTAS